MSMKEGWKGRYFEDFAEGDVYRHPFGRTVIETDNVWFTNLTLNTNQIHFNNDYASRTNYKKPLVNSCFTLALVNGMSVIDTSQNGMVLEWTNVRMPNPLFVGETVYAETTVLEKRESKSRPGQGIVSVKTRGITAEGKVIMEFNRKIMIYKKDFAPKMEIGPKTEK